MKSSAAPADLARPTDEVSGNRDPYRPWIAEQIQHWTVSVDYLLEPLNSSADTLLLKLTEPVIPWNTARTPGTAPRNPRRSSSLSNATATSLSGMPSTAKRLGGVTPLPVPGEMRLAGVPMRQATTGLSGRRLTLANSGVSVVNDFGVPLARAKRI